MTPRKSPGKTLMSMSILRLGFLLVLIGFFAPLGCDISGYQLAHGILGNTRQAGNAVVLGSIEDVYGYLLLFVFVFALLGLVFTFLSKALHIPFLDAVCLALSLVLLAVVALRLESFQSSGAPRLILAIIPIKVKPLVGGYSMAAGYLAGLAGIVLRFMGR